MMEHLEEGEEVQGRRGKRQIHSLFSTGAHLGKRGRQKALQLKQVQSFHHYMRLNILVTY